MGEEKQRNTIPRNPGTIPGTLFMFFVLRWFCSLPNHKETPNASFQFAGGRLPMVKGLSRRLLQPRLPYQNYPVSWPDRHLKLANSFNLTALAGKTSMAVWLEIVVSDHPFTRSVLSFSNLPLPNPSCPRAHPHHQRDDLHNAKAKRAILAKLHNLYMMNSENYVYMRIGCEEFSSLKMPEATFKGGAVWTGPDGVAARRNGIYSKHFFAQESVIVGMLIDELQDLFADPRLLLVLACFHLKCFSFSDSLDLASSNWLSGN